MGVIGYHFDWLRVERPTTGEFYACQCDCSKSQENAEIVIPNVWHGFRRNVSVDASVVKVICCILFVGLDVGLLLLVARKN